MSLVLGIPREAVALAAGLKSGDPTATWIEVACSLALLGFGSISPAILATAVMHWSMERVEVVSGRGHQEQLDVVAEVRAKAGRPS